MIGVIQLKHRGYEYGSNSGYSKSREFSENNFYLAEGILPFSTLCVISKRLGLKRDGDSLAPLMQYMLKEKEGKIEEISDNGRMEIEIYWGSGNLQDKKEAMLLYSLAQGYEPLSEEIRNTLLKIKKEIRAVNNYEKESIDISAEKITNFTYKFKGVYFRPYYEAKGMNNSIKVLTCEVWTETHACHSLRVVSWTVNCE